MQKIEKHSKMTPRKPVCSRRLKVSCSRHILYGKKRSISTSGYLSKTHFVQDFLKTCKLKHWNCTILRDVLKKCTFKIWSTKPQSHQLLPLLLLLLATGYCNCKLATCYHYWVSYCNWLLATATASGYCHWLLLPVLATGYSYLLLLLLATAIIATCCNTVRLDKSSYIRSFPTKLP